MQIVTANRLADGLVVFHTGEGWTDEVRRARVLAAEEAEAVIGRVKAEPPTQVVGPYAVEVGPDGLPTKGRERIRALGPTVRPDLSGPMGI